MLDSVIPDGRQMLIFINYRRGDADALSLQVRDFLTRRGDLQVFLDTDAEYVGAVPERIDTALRGADLMVVLIGPNWVAELHRRLNANLDDWVRTEIVMALRREIRIAPLLVDGAEMPQLADLPNDMRRLTVFQRFTIQLTDPGAGLANLEQKIRQIALQSTGTRNRATRLLGSARRFAMQIRQEWQRTGLRMKWGLETATRHANSGTPVTLDLDIRRLVVVASGFHTLFRNLDDETFFSDLAGTAEGLSRDGSLRSSTIRDLFSSTLRSQTGTAYCFQNVDRVLRAVDQILSINGEKFSDDLVRPSPIAPLDHDAAAIVCCPEGDGICVRTISSEKPIKLVGTYVARRARLFGASLRAPRDDEPRLYAADKHTVYRWNLQDGRPESVWSFDDRTISCLHIPSCGPVEFAIGKDTVHLVKHMREPDLVEVPIAPANGYDRRARIVEDSATGKPTLWIAIEWCDRAKASLTVERLQLDPLGNPERVEVDIRDATRIHEHLLMRNGRKLIRDITTAVYPSTYKGFRCALVVDVLLPHGAAVFFIDIETGVSLRTPVVAPCDVTELRIIRSGVREFLLCQTWQSDEPLLVFDVSDDLQVEPVSNVRSFGFSPVAHLIPLTHTRVLASFHDSYNADPERNGPSIGLINFGTGEPVFTFLDRIPSLATGAAQLAR
jgi:hypothetical protein